MVFYFKTSDGHLVYMGKDKYENEYLLKHFLPIDIWFHVDNYSSAHVYLRLKTQDESQENKNESIREKGEHFPDGISQSAIDECA